MTQEFDLRLQYNQDSVVIFELADDGTRYELVRWTKDELESTPNLPKIVEDTKDLMEQSPRGLIEKLYGTVRNWEDAREDREIDSKYV